MCDFWILQASAAANEPMEWWKTCKGLRSVKFFMYIQGLIAKLIKYTLVALGCEVLENPVNSSNKVIFGLSFIVVDTKWIVFCSFPNNEQGIKMV